MPAVVKECRAVNFKSILHRRHATGLGVNGLAAGVLLAAVALMAAQSAPPGTDQPKKVPPAPSQGSVSPSGKFVPSQMLPPKNTGVAPQTPAEAESALKQALKVRQTGSNTFQIGQVELDKQLRTVSLAARMAVRTQAVEYALVNEKGKAYESLLITAATPSEVHVAFLLLGVSQVPVAGDFNKAATVPDTNSLRIEVAWEENGRPRTNALCDLISLVDEPQAPADQRKEPSARPMPSRQWLYNGSVFDDLGFAAQREGSIIAVIRDSAALVNNPGEDRDNDRVHFPNTKLLPPEGAPVRLVLRLPERVLPPVPPKAPWDSPITPLSTNRYVPEPGAPKVDR